VELVAPRLIAVEPIVKDEFVSALFGIFVSVLVEPLIDLFVNVSVVARPTSVSVEVGNVNVPVFTIEAMFGVISCRFVTLVAVPPSETVVEPSVIELLVSAPFGIFVNVFEDPDIDLLVKV
jgi:hypothetical protein